MSQSIQFVWYRLITLYFLLNECEVVSLFTNFSFNSSLRKLYRNLLVLFYICRSINLANNKTLFMILFRKPSISFAILNINYFNYFFWTSYYLLTLNPPRNVTKGH